MHWIGPKGHLFKDFAFERFIKIGPSPTLTGMAMRTIKVKYEAQVGFCMGILWVGFSHMIPIPAETVTHGG